MNVATIMNAFQLPLLVMLLCFVSGVCGAQNTPAKPTEPTSAELRAEFLHQELITAQPMTRVFTPGEPPRIIWRDVDKVRELGGAGKPQVRWFDAELRETAVPNHPGRWAAWVEDRGPGDVPVRRLMSFYARPSNFLAYLFGASMSFPPLPGPIPEDVWREHQAEMDQMLGKQIVLLNDSEEGAVLLSALSEAKAQGRPPLPLETAQARQQDFFLAVRMKAQHLEGRIQVPQPPRKLAKPAPVIHKGSAAEAGMKPGAKAAIDAVLEAWAKDSTEPFVTLVARHGVIVTHKAAGRDKQGRPIGLDYRANVASITKTTTGALFSVFLDQGLLRLDDKVSVAFPNLPMDNPHVPTFRQCFTHTSGLHGHSPWGDGSNVLMDNFFLTSLDTNEPGKKYEYSGTGYDLAAMAMQLRSGKALTRLYHDHLFGPLDIHGATITNANAGADYTALDLAKLAQWLVNRGSYGDQQLITPETFEALMPEDLSRRYPDIKNAVDGIGIHWMGDHNPTVKQAGAPPWRLLGHGSFTSCVLDVEMNRQIIIVQARRSAGENYHPWLNKLLQTVADNVVEEAGKPDGAR